MDVNQLRVALVGAGWMGGRHGHAVTEHGDSVSVVVDRLGERAEALASVFGAVASNGLATAPFDSIDAAIVCTPTSDHSQTSRYLLDRGIPVLVEKPHRMPSQDPWRIRDDDPLCWVGLSTRYLRGMAAVRNAVKEGLLGEIVFWSDRIWFELSHDSLPRWYFDPAIAGGGVLTTNGVHALDRVRWMLGSVRVESSYLGGLFDDHRTEDVAVLTGVSGQTCVEISLLWSKGAVPPSELTVVGTDGTASVRQGKDWEIVADGRSERGTEAGGEDPLVSQWGAFRVALLTEGHDGPTPHSLERVMNDIQDVYSRHEENPWT